MEQDKEIIEAGDVVWLKSGGGPAMTVNQVIGNEAQVSWFFCGIVHKGTFALAALTRRKPS